MTKTLVKEKIYPEYSTYKGTAYKNVAYIEQISILDLEWAMTGVIEAEANAKGVKLLYARIYSEGEGSSQSQPWLTVNKYDIDIAYYYPPGVQPPPQPENIPEGVYTFFPWAVVAILVLIIIVLVVVYYLITEAHTMLWNNGPTILSYTLLLLGIGVAMAGVGYFLTKLPKRGGVPGKITGGQPSA